MDSKKTITKNSLIKTVANISGRDVYAVKDIINTMQNVVFGYITSVDKKNTDVVIKIFDGMSIEAKYVPKHNKISNLTGNEIRIDDKVKTKLNVTRTYCKKLTPKKNNIYDIF